MVSEERKSNETTLLDDFCLFFYAYRKLICGVGDISWRRRIRDVLVNSSGIHDRDRKTDCYMNL